MNTPRRHPNVIHRDEVEPVVINRGKHHVTRRRFGNAAGNQQLGGSLMEVPPGALGYPQHYHCANEEAIYVIAGTGVARIGERRVPVGPGDWIAYPVGPAHAHQMINDGEVPLVYLAIGTAHRCDVIGYPDSNKVAAWAEGPGEEEWFNQRVLAGESLDYWEGEPGA